MVALNLLRIPSELRERRQWAVSTMTPGVDGKPDKAPRNPTTGLPISVTDPSGFVTWAEAANAGYPAIGYILTHGDPFTVIDLDASDDPEVIKHQTTVYNEFAPTYADRTVSGRGCHIWARGVIGGGIRRSGIEVYDRERYIITTGDTLREMPIVDMNGVLLDLVRVLGGIDRQLELHPSEPEETSDDDILERARNAVNGQKFSVLFDTPPTPGDDHSQLDSQLAQFIAFYTRNHEQAIRLFRRSALYRGTKGGYNTTQKYEEDYLLRQTFGHAWSMLKKDESVRAADIEFGRKVAENIKASYEVAGKGMANHGARDEQIPPAPGLIGEIEAFLYSKGQTLLPEAALGGAIGFVAGLAGRQYNTSTNTGLNQYVVVVGYSGKGKEIANTGTDAIYHSLRLKFPSMTDHFRGDFASGQALVRIIGEQSCFVARFGEMGHLLKMLSSPRANSADLALRRALLDVYTKSGKGQYLHGREYSDSQKNAKEVHAPAVTIIGDTTPNVFYECIDTGLAEEGLLGRMLVLENTDPTIYQNPSPNMDGPSDELLEKVGNLFMVVEQMRINDQFYPVPLTDTAAEMLDAYKGAQRSQASALRDDGPRDVVNRAHLKALRLASLAAVGVNPSNPIVDEECVTWACCIVDLGHKRFLDRYASGQVGMGDNRQEAEVVKCVQEYAELPPNKRRAYKAPKCLCDNPAVVAHEYIRYRLKNKAAFKHSRIGVARQINEAVTTLVKAGVLSEISIEQKVALSVRPDIRCYTYGPEWESDE